MAWSPSLSFSASRSVPELWNRPIGSRIWSFRLVDFVGEKGGKKKNYRHYLTSLSISFAHPFIRFSSLGKKKRKISPTEQSANRLEKSKTTSTPTGRHCASGSPRACQKHDVAARPTKSSVCPWPRQHLGRLPRPEATATNLKRSTIRDCYSVMH